MAENHSPLDAAPPAETIAEKPSRLKAVLTKVWDVICEHWFILGLGFAIGFAAAVPDFGRTGGWIAAQWTIKYGAVIIIFLLSGCSLKTKALLTVLARLHVHLFIQFICLVLTPAIGYGIARGLMDTGMDADLVNGLVVAMCMPTTISTNVVFTKQSGGNEPAALVNAVIGNLIGIFISPAWLYLYLGKSGQAPYANVIKQLAVTIIAPIIVGQLLQYFVPKFVKAAQEKINFGKVGNLMIILLVWNTFCDTFHRDVQINAKSWVPMVFLEIGIFATFVVMCLGLATFVPLKHIFKFDKPDAVAVVMCGSTKTLALGMPLITVMYGKNANVGVVALPLIIYHASQCLLGSIMIKRLKKWVDGSSPGAWPPSCWPAVEADAVEPISKAPPSTNTNGASNGTGLGTESSSGKPAAGAGDAATASDSVTQEDSRPFASSGPGPIVPADSAPWPVEQDVDLERGETVALVNSDLSAGGAAPQSGSVSRRHSIGKA